MGGDDAYPVPEKEGSLLVSGLGMVALAVGLALAALWRRFHG